MAREFVIGCVGKPSAGKSTFFNAATDSQNAKVGAYPFTTIEPNTGVTFGHVECPCTKWPVKNCTPRYGSCKNGRRAVPIKLLDVAGLIPGASTGRGLGNKFLDDLRHADVLLHILDVSGTTNEKGEATLGYDPSLDHEWLESEIQLWIYNNLWPRWKQIVRKHDANKATVHATLQQQFSGYGADEKMVTRLVEAAGLASAGGGAFAAWDADNVMQLVKCFVTIKFPFILVLNKADLPGGNTEQNIIKITSKFPANRVVVASALAESFLQKMRRTGFITYEPGAFSFETFEKNATLKQMDSKTLSRCEKIKDMVLFRYGSTGVQNAIQMAIELGGLLPVFPVRTREFANATEERPAAGSAFAECLMVPTGTVVKEIAAMLHEKIARCFVGAEDGDGRQIGENEAITRERNVIRILTHREE